MQESHKAQENGEAYALRTTRNAAAAIERRGGPQRREERPRSRLRKNVWMARGRFLLPLHTYPPLPGLAIAN